MGIHIYIYVRIPTYKVYPYIGISLYMGISAYTDTNVLWCGDNGALSGPIRCPAMTFRGDGVVDAGQAGEFVNVACAVQRRCARRTHQARGRVRRARLQGPSACQPAQCLVGRGARRLRRSEAPAARRGCAWRCSSPSARSSRMASRAQCAPT